MSVTDKTDEYRQTVEKVLDVYTLIPYAYGDLRTVAAYDRERDHFLLIAVGFDRDGRRVHFCLAHVAIIGGKVWVQHDGTEDGIANELVAAGIPKDRIVLGFKSPEIRRHTGFAAG